MSISSVTTPSGGGQAADNSGTSPDGSSDTGDMSQGYTICIKVDAQQKISVGVTPSGADDGDADDDSSDYAPAKNIKDALTTALDIYRNAGQMSDSDSDFSGGFSASAKSQLAAPSTYDSSQQ